MRCQRHACGVTPRSPAPVSRAGTRPAFRHSRAGCAQGADPTAVAAPGSVGVRPTAWGGARGAQKPRFALIPPGYDRPMLSLLYLVVRTLVRLVVGAGQPGRDEHAKDLEILVLRHQLRVLQRTVSPPRLRTNDRVLLAA